MKAATEIIVRNYHIDHFGHVNHARYLELLEEARWRAIDGNEVLIPHVVSEIRMRYRKPARMGDVLLIQTEIPDGKDRHFTVRQTVRLKATGKLIAEAELRNVRIGHSHLEVQNDEEPGSSESKI